MLPSVPRRTEKTQKPPPRLGEVLEAGRLTPNMQRVVLGGEELTSFRPGCVGANLKIVVPPKGEDREAFQTRLNTATASRIVRTFTVAAHDPNGVRLTVDFALHEGEGAAPAADWARAAKPGDVLGIMGPGQRKLTEFTGAPFLLYGDMTAIPAIAAILADLPKDASGHAIFEVTDAADARDLPGPKGITVNWLIHPDPSQPSNAALDHVKSLDLNPALQAGIAGEHSVVKAIEAYLTEDIRIDPAHSYLAPYWKIGLVEDEHQILKRA